MKKLEFNYPLDSNSHAIVICDWDGEDAFNIYVEGLMMTGFYGDNFIVGRNYDEEDYINFPSEDFVIRTIEKDLVTNDDSYKDLVRFIKKEVL
jgi:hypothetical protein